MGEEYVSSDGQLCFRVITDEDCDVTLGFAGFPSHTHADILSELTGLPKAEAVRQYIADLIGGQSVIVLWSVSGELRDVWVSDDPTKDANYLSTPYAESGESVVMRYWDGRVWQAEPGIAQVP